MIYENQTHTQALQSKQIKFESNQHSHGREYAEKSGQSLEFLFLKKEVGS